MDDRPPNLRSHEASPGLHRGPWWGHIGLSNRNLDELAISESCIGLDTVGHSRLLRRPYPPHALNQLAKSLATLGRDDSQTGLLDG